MIYIIILTMASCIFIIVTGKDLRGLICILGLFVIACVFALCVLDLFPIGTHKEISGIYELVPIQDDLYIRQEGDYYTFSYKGENNALVELKCIPEKNVEFQHTDIDRAYVKIYKNMYFIRNPLTFKKSNPFAIDDDISYVIVY